MSFQTPAVPLARGWNEQRFDLVTLTEASLNGAAQTTGLGGLFEVEVTGVLTINAGTGSVQLVFEGSNDGTTWQTISALSHENLLTAGALSQRFATPVERWQQYRVRAVEVNPAGFDWDCAVRVVGLRRSGQRVLIGSTPGTAETLARSAATSNSNAIPRGENNRYSSIQVVTAAFAGAGSTNLVLQGSPDGGTTWFDISDALNISANGTQTLLQDGARLIDLGQWQFLRFQAVDAGGGTTAYTLTIRVSADDSDWPGAESPGATGAESIAPVLYNGLVQVVQDAATAEAANRRSVTLRLQTLDGIELQQLRRLKLVLSDTQHAGDDDLSAIAFFAAVGVGGGTAITGLNRNVIVMQTETDGTCTLAIEDSGTETIYLSAYSYGVPNNNVVFAIVQTEEQAIAFA